MDGGMVAGGVYPEVCCVWQQLKLPRHAGHIFANGED
jgi:hypothetical protein